MNNLNEIKTEQTDERIKDYKFIIPKEEKQTKDKLFKFLGLFGKDIRTKISNVNGKTAAYYVPEAIYTQRTNRRNRVLLPWKDLVQNNLSLKELQTFYGGVTIEFVNEDFFNPNTENKELLKIYNFLKSERIGSDEQLSAVITFRSEGGSSSQKERDNYEKILKDTKINYKGSEVIINKDTISNFYLKSTASENLSNKYWEGFIFVDICGGQQNSIRSHPDKKAYQTIFNPACEYANDQVINDIDLVLGYYILMSIHESDLKAYATINDKTFEYMYETKNSLIIEIENVLKTRKYSNSSFTGTLYDFVSKAISLKIEDGKLFDPIQLKEITLKNFADVDARTGDSIDLTHDEPVCKKAFHWDKEQNFLLSAAMPTNIFWSYHLSNMMQQDFSLFEYYRHEEEIYLKRKEIFEKLNIDINKQ